MREARVEAEAAWRQLPRPLPAWLAWMLPGLIALGLPAYVVCMILGWAFRGWFPTPLHMLGWGIFTPIFAVIFFGIDAAAARSYARRSLAMNAQWTGEGWSCRACGGPLATEPNRLAATCDYCGADSVLTSGGARWQAFIRQGHAEAVTSLAQAVDSLAASRKERRLTRIIVFACILPFWLLFCGPLIYAEWTGVELESTDVE